MGDYLQELGPFRTILHNEFQTHFKTPALHYTVFSFSMGETFQNDSVKSPWNTTLRKLVLSGPPIHSEVQTPFKTPTNHMPHLVNGLISRPFGRGKEHRAHCSTV